LLIWHLNYSAILSKYIPTDYFFGDFTHWVIIIIHIGGIS